MTEQEYIIQLGQGWFCEEVDGNRVESHKEATRFLDIELCQATAMNLNRYANIIELGKCNSVYCDGRKLEPDEWLCPTHPFHNQ